MTWHRRRSRRLARAGQPARGRRCVIRAERSQELFPEWRESSGRLPREFRFKGDRVRVRRAGRGILVPMFANVTDWFAELDRFGAAFQADGVVDRLRPSERSSDNDVSPRYGKTRARRARGTLRKYKSTAASRGRAETVTDCDNSTGILPYSLARTNNDRNRAGLEVASQLSTSAPRGAHKTLLPAHAKPRSRRARVSVVFDPAVISMREES